MFAYIHGKVDEIDSESIVLAVNGIGYLIFCANPFSFQKYKNQQRKVYTYHYVREDLIALYGFHTRQERELFSSLLSVSGIGPKGALAILAACTPDEVAAAVENEDERYLIQFPGVGKKTARQMILDLKGKLSFPGVAGTTQDKVNSSQKAQNEAIEALRALGYAEREIQRVMNKIPGEQFTTDQYVKKALQHMLQH